MEKSDYLTFGLVGAALLGVAALATQRQSSSSSGPSGSSAAIDQSIIQANTTALTTGAQVTLGLASLKADVAKTLDTNQTAIAIAASQGATQTQLGAMAEKATEFAADTSSKTAIALSNNDVAKTQAQVQGAVNIASNADVAQQNVASTQAGATVAAANAAANANIAASNNAASASKTASNDNLWGSIIGTVGGLLSGFFNQGWNPQPSPAIDNAALYSPPAIPSPVVPVLPPIGSNTPAWTGIGPP